MHASQHTINVVVQDGHLGEARVVLLLNLHFKRLTSYLLIMKRRKRGAVYYKGYLRKIRKRLNIGVNVG